MIYRVYVIDSQGRRHLRDKTSEDTLIDLLIKSAWNSNAMRVDAVEVTRGELNSRSEEVMYRGDRTQDGRILAATGVGIIRPVLDA